MSKEYSKELELDFGRDGLDLIPVVTQDVKTHQVLILSFVNLEAFKKTRETGLATYWSRSRNELWIKGASSGDYLEVNEIRINCEQNSLLFLVTPKGSGACHAKKENGDSHSGCYYRKVLKNGQLEFIE